MVRKNNYNLPSRIYVPEKIYVEFLKQNRDMFTVGILKMPGFAPTVVMHRLAIEAERCPMKQVSRRMHPDLFAKLEIKVDKLVKSRLHKGGAIPHRVGKSCAFLKEGRVPFAVVLWT